MTHRLRIDRSTHNPLEVKMEAQFKFIAPEWSEDVNQDGSINILDIAMVAKKFGRSID